MEVINLGYACINDELNTRPVRISTTRTLSKKEYLHGGLRKVGQLALDNLKDLLKILEWNEQHGIKLFRLSSNIFPWKNEWSWSQLDQWDECKQLLEQAGDYARKHGHRLTFHPGPYNKLCSQDSRILGSTIRELETHSTILDLMGFSEASHYNSINIHIGAAYRNKGASLRRWCYNFRRLSQRLKARITVENDDLSSLYNTEELYTYVYQETGVPIMFDFHHYNCNPSPNWTQQKSAQRAIQTWPEDVRPLFHWSESRDSSVASSPHSDLCHGPLPDYELSRPIDLMIESKNKEKSIFTLTNHRGDIVHGSYQKPKDS